jgi:hypothetical protein
MVKQTLNITLIKSSSKCWTRLVQQARVTAGVDHVVVADGEPESTEQRPGHP